jgi:Flp pilus assembly protein TadD
MSKHARSGAVVSIAVIASLMAGCASPQAHTISAGSIKADSDVALASRAAAALAANDYTTAVSLAERAAEKSPTDLAVRTLLGNAYFGAGRFASAESAYKDALTVESNQPRVILRLVLVDIAQGKTDEALRYLNAGRDVLDASDYGLALALAGHARDAVAVLEPAARQVDADSQVRQNLALAYALAGDWTNARTIAGQDVPADQLDARIHQWMQLATPHHASDQVAALIGVTPAASDPGQPVRLALRQTDTRLAAASPALVVPTPVAAPVAFASVAPASSVTVSLPPAAPIEQAPVQQAEVIPAPAPLPVRHIEVPAAAVSMAQAAMASPEAPAAFAAMMTRASLPMPVRKPPVRRAAAPQRLLAIRDGRSGAVVQLGAYASPQRVAAAWNAAARRFGGLRGYSPMSARFDSARGPVYRLSVKGFASYGEANGLCVSVRRSGGNCFVRNVAGDAPVQIAMR